MENASATDVEEDKIITETDSENKEVDLTRLKEYVIVTEVFLFATVTLVTPAALFFTLKFALISPLLSMGEEIDKFLALRALRSPAIVNDPIVEDRWNRNEFYSSDPKRSTAYQLSHNAHQFSSDCGKVVFFTAKINKSNKHRAQCVYQRQGPGGGMSLCGRYLCGGAVGVGADLEWVCTEVAKVGVEVSGADGVDIVAVGFRGDRTGVRSMSIRSVSLVVVDDTSDVTMMTKAVVLVAMFRIPDLQGTLSVMDSGEDRMSSSMKFDISYI
eukprot:gene14924-6063_t